MKNSVNITIAIGDDNKTATVRFSARSTPIVCKILGSEKNSDNQITKYYLDSLIHSEKGESTYLNWAPSGCISTILTRVN